RPDVVAILVADQLLSLQQVGQRRRYVAHLVARGLGVPAGETLVGRRVPTRLDRQRLRNDGGRQRPLLAEAEEPVDAHLLIGGDGGQGLGARQAVVGLRE